MGTTLIIIPFLFLMVFVPFFLLGTPQENMLSDSQRQIYRVFMISLAITSVPLFLLLFLIAQSGYKGMFFVSVMPVFVSIVPVLFIITLLLYRWKYHRDVPKISFIVLMTTLLTFNVLLCIGAYYMQVNVRQNLPERLPPLVPEPADYSLPPHLQHLQPVVAPAPAPAVPDTLQQD